MTNAPNGPDRKVVAGGLAGALTVVAVWAVQEFARVEVPAEVAASVTVIITAIVSYLVPRSAKL